MFSATRPTVAETARPTVLMAYCSWTSGHSGSREVTADIVEIASTTDGHLRDDQADDDPAPVGVRPGVEDRGPVEADQRGEQSVRRQQDQAGLRRWRHRTRTIGAGGGRATPVRVGDRCAQPGRGRP